ncbi:uncharacterized protein G2W53_000828 [Senna tora]|uniref:Uncharacterized protein n=1 Tax=Senna tora TaxID=362788 RepID=A0A834XEU0_9FABA|nr:uncharacterized protein G2W53_000828 [Senna tora]
MAGGKVNAEKTARNWDYVYGALFLHSEKEMGWVPHPPDSPRRSGGKINKTKYCCFHKDYRYNTDECITLEEEIEELIQRGKLGRFIRLTRGAQERLIILKGKINRAVRARPPQSQGKKRQSRSM